jgi:hypothetical protein
LLWGVRKFRDKAPYPRAALWHQWDCCPCLAQLG